MLAAGRLHLLVLAVVEEAHRADDRLGHHRAGSGADRQGDGDHAVVGEQLALAQHGVVHLALGGAVDEHGLAVGEAGHARAALCDLEDIAVGQDEDVLKRHAQLVRQLRVLVEHAGLAVGGNEELRAHQAVHQLDFLLGGVTGDVHIRQRGVVHLRVALVQFVDDLVDGLFVARDRRGGDDDGVARLNLQLAVVVEGDAGERAHRLALGAGGDDAHLLRRQLVHLGDLDERVRLHLDVAQVVGRVEHVEHAAAHERDLAAVALGGGEDLLQAGDVRGERRHEDAALCVLEHVGHGFADVALGLGEARHLDVRGLAHEEQHALAANLRDALQVHDVAADGRIVDLEVAGVHDGADRRADGEHERVRDGVVHVDELHGEAARADHLARLHGAQRAALGQARDAVVELVLEQLHGHFAAVDGRLELAHQVRQAADVVLMAVGDEDTAHAVSVLQHIGEVRDDGVHAGHGLVREDLAAVDDDDVVAVLVGRHVLADLAHAAQRDHAQCRAAGVLAGAGAHRRRLLADQLQGLGDERLVRLRAGGRRHAAAARLGMRGRLSACQRPGSLRARGGRSRLALRRPGGLRLLLGLRRPGSGLPARRSGRGGTGAGLLSGLRRALRGLRRPRLRPLRLLYLAVLGFSGLLHRRTAARRRAFFILNLTDLGGFAVFVVSHDDFLSLIGVRSMSACCFLPPPEVSPARSISAAGSGMSLCKNP